MVDDSIRHITKNEYSLIHHMSAVMRKDLQFYVMVSFLCI